MDFSSTDLKAFSDHFLSVPRTTELISSKVGTGKEVQSCENYSEGLRPFSKRNY